MSSGPGNGSVSGMYSAALKYVNPLISLDVSVVLPLFFYFIITNFYV